MIATRADLVDSLLAIAEEALPEAMAASRQERVAATARVLDSILGSAPLDAEIDDEGLALVHAWLEQQRALVQARIEGGRR